MTAASAVVLVGLTVFAVVWFEPHKLFIDDRVDEALPEVDSLPGPASASPTGGALPGPTASPAASVPATPSGSETTDPEPAPEGPTTLAEGGFHPLEHDADGSARVIQLQDGSLFLRFDDLNVSNGPDLRVYLTDQPLSDDLRVWDDGAFLDLGDLKGNIGDQNYELPAGFDLSRWRTAVIWCRRFTVGFAVAPLTPV